MFLEFCRNAREKYRRKTIQNARSENSTLSTGSLRSIEGDNVHVPSGGPASETSADQNQRADTPRRSISRTLFGRRRSHGGSDQDAECSSDNSWVQRHCSALSRNDPSMEELELDTAENDLNEEDLKNLSHSLITNRVVSRIIFRHVEVGFNTTDYLGPILQSSSSITALHLEDSGENGQMTTARCLTRNPDSSVRELHIKGNRISVKSAEALGRMLEANQSISDLTLCHNWIDYQAVEYLARGLQGNHGLVRLDLIGNGLGGVAISKVAHALQHNMSLKSLCLDFNDFGSHGSRAISHMLGRNTCLEQLDLFGNGINASSMVLLADALCENFSLKSLNLSFNRIGDEGLHALARALTVNTTLKKVWFPANEVGVEGLEAFGNLIPRMRGVEELHVGDYFDVAGAEAILQGLRRNTRIKVLLMESAVDDNGDMERKLDFYLRLNRAGRRLVEEPHAPLGLWSMVLSRANQLSGPQASPDAFYDMLRSKPDLVGGLR